VLGRWQLGYFYEVFTLQSPKLHLLVADAENSPASRNLWYRNALPRVAAELRADIVHLAYPVPVRRRSFRMPVVVTLHDLYPYDAPENFGYPQVYVNRLILHQCMRNADAVACISETTLDRLLLHIPATWEQAVVIPNCVDLALGGPMKNPLPNWRGGPFFLCVAQHRANKNIAGLLHTFAALLRRGEIHPATSLVVVGNEGPETKALRALLRHLSIEKDVLLIDGVSHAGLLWLYRNCELVISPSQVEGFSFPVAEALFCGARVVCSDIPAHREIAGDSAEYFDPAAAIALESLSSAICAALAEKPKPAPTSLLRFSIANVSRQYMELYRKLLTFSSKKGSTTMSSIHGRLKQANVLGVGIHAVNMDDAAAIVHAALQTDGKGLVCMAGVHGVMVAQHDPDLRAIYADALLVAPDGMPTVWIGHHQGHATMQRVGGPDLMMEVLERPEFRDCTHFLCGGDEGVAEDLREKLLARMPYLKIVGTYMPPFREMTPAEEQDFYDHVQSVTPDIIWVGLGMPKQEKFMARHIAKLDTKLMFGVGAAFNIHSGRLKDSPAWVKHIGMQWLHRLLQEPNRLWKRYLVNNTLFVLRIALQFIGIRKPLLQPEVKIAHPVFLPANNESSLSLNS
jgi:N-acetylglucosaminyldiphosphoundecaprenol N-acetyl-beta-D-mannosaminyltransferase